MDNIVGEGSAELLSIISDDRGLILTTYSIPVSIELRCKISSKLIK